MITAIVIQNFKGIGNEPFRLPIKPITLLFGPNSAGKSTILQAIHYACEILERHNLNPDRTATGGKHVDLGGFERFVHRRMSDRRITLGFELHPPFPLRSGQGELSSGFPTHFAKTVGLATPHHDGYVDVGSEIERVQVELTIGCYEGRPYVHTYAVGFNTHPFASLCCDPKLPEFHAPRVRRMLGRVNFESPILRRSEWGLTSTASLLDHLDEDPCLSYGARREQRFRLHEIDALPNLDRQSLPLAIFDERGSSEDIPEEFHELISHFLLVPGRILREELRQFRYIGPLREAPPAWYEPPKTDDPTRWSTGLAAWDALHRESDEFREAVDEWLWNEDRLNTGYHIRRRRYVRVDTEDQDSGDAMTSPDNLDAAFRTEVTLNKPRAEGDVLPQEIGAGISQVLPIVVGCILSGDYLLGIEQPELHLHPRVQCELGDLMIAGALGKDVTGEPLRRTIIVETHSEHLILRILHRIRDTTRGIPHDGIEVVPEDISVCYVAQEDGQSVPRTIHIDHDGEFVELWPDQFFELDFYERFD